MPNARPKLQMLKPRLQELPPRIPTLKAPRAGKTLKEKQEANGRTLALNGATWRKLRAAVLAEQPLCPECKDQGALVPATEVDHHDNDPSNNDRDNLVGLCKAHHSQKTSREMRGLTARPYGCDTDGIPLDPDHPWRRTVEELKKSPRTTAHEPPGSSRVTANRKE
jgi:hypothetical protein